MKRWITVVLVIILLGFIHSTFATPPVYGKVLVRVNAGGIKQPATDTSKVEWATDNIHTPCICIDTSVAGNKSWGDLTPITYDPSVPSYVPMYVFQIERDLAKYTADSLEYHFPIEAGKRVEVRLYFAEVYMDSVKKRLFDIYVENDLKIKDYDIFADVGRYVGVMKSFIVTSDGTLNIFLKRVKQLPKINGIEIIEVRDLELFTRINTGGFEVPANDGTGISWQRDDSHIPSPFFDTVANGNKTFVVTDDITLDASVPTSTPVDIFNSERDLGRWDVKDLTYNIPIPAGKKVDVKLYFSELFYDSPGIRVFDILINGNLMANDYDVFADVGKFKGVAKIFTVMSDTGNVRITLRRVKQQPKIDGIEIIESNAPLSSILQVSAVTKSHSSILVSAFPNPFSNEIHFDFGNTPLESMKLFDAMGREINIAQIELGAQKVLRFENHPKGIYYLKVEDDKSNSQTIKLVKE